MKQTVAIIIPGGIGTGKNSIGVPVLERIIGLLSKDNQVTVFQLFNPNPGYRVYGYELINVYSSNVIVKLIKFLISFRKLNAQQKFKVVHGFWVLPNGFLSVLVGKMFGIKSVVSVLGGDAIHLPEIKYGQLNSWLYRKLIFWTLKNANEVNALTNYLVNNLEKNGFKRDSIGVIPWGIDTTLFEYREPVVNEPIQFLHIANLHPVKDQETLLRAFKIISETISARLTIIGTGISAAHVADLIMELNLNDKVKIIEFVPYTELPSIYHQAHILLHTSLSEGQCEVVTEAMSCGVLVCGTSVGLLYDQPNCCVSVAVKDYKQLAHKTLELLSNPEGVKNQRQRALDWCKEHSIWWTVERINESYNKEI